MPFSNGYDASFRVNMDPLGILYVCIIASWTLALIPASIFLIRNRRLPYLRMRNITLAIGSVATLHVYWVLTFVAYVLNGFFPCSTEFWIMSIYLPLGIALFQAANTQLLHIADLQKKFAKEESTLRCVESSNDGPGWRVVLRKVKGYNPTKRTMTMIGVGMIVQFIASMVIFLMSRKFHSDFGAVGKPTLNLPSAMVECRRGWEWWPSIAWQFAWSWVYAPYLLWKVRGIKDVHGWRLQTVCCALAGLPASPLWLSALYLDAFSRIRRYWIPPLWFAPSIMLMQGFVVFVPCYQVYKNRRLETSTRQIIAEWEHKKKYGNSLSSGSTRVGSRFSMRSSKSTASSRSGEMYTLSTLQKTLRLNPKPLLLFAALKDFSGENISFLTHVDEWTANWYPPPTKNGVFKKNEKDTRDPVALRRAQFNLAVHIYSSFISLRYSAFPINISSAHQKELEAMFDLAAAEINSGRADNAATPFADWHPSTKDDIEKGMRYGETSVSSTACNSVDDIMASPERKHYSQVQAFKLSNFTDTLLEDVLVPDSFGPDAFKNAEASIKELVLTNTWPKFVNAGYAGSMKGLTLNDRLGRCRVGVKDVWQSASGAVRKRTTSQAKWWPASPAWLSSGIAFRSKASKAGNDRAMREESSSRI